MSSAVQSSADKKAEKARQQNEYASRTFETLILIFAIASIVALVVPVIVQMADPASPAMLRSAPFLVSAIFFVVVISVYIDRELFDYVLAFIAGGLAVLGHFLQLVQEIGRWNQCAGGTEPVTAIETKICTDYRAWIYFVPLLALIIFGITIILIVMLAAWIRKTYKTVREEQKKNKELRKAQNKDAAATWYRVATAVLAVAQTLIVIFVAVLSVALPNYAAFFRASFLIPSAFAAGAEMAFFGSVPKYWNYVTSGFALFACVSTIWGLVYEFPRFTRCTATPSVPDGVIESSICNNEGLAVGVVPISLLVSFFVAFAILVTSIIQLATKRN